MVRGAPECRVFPPGLALGPHGSYALTAQLREADISTFFDASNLPIAERWFSIDAVDAGILRITEPHCAAPMRANAYLVRGDDRDLLVDSGMGIGQLRAALPLTPGKPLTLFTTHSHVDHIGGHHDFPECEILVHASEAADLRAPPVPTGLGYDHFDPQARADLTLMGFRTDGLMIDALPRPGYRPDRYRCQGVEPTRLVDEGDALDIGGRRFAILHLPGHSPGGLGLWDAATGVLVTGDTLFDGLPLDTIEGAHIPSLAASLRRLRDLPARLVLGGHRDPFGRDRMIEVIDTYLAYRSAVTGDRTATRRFRP